MRFGLLVISFILSLGSVFLFVANSGEEIILGFPVRFVIFHHLDLYNSPFSALNPINFLSMDFSILLLIVNASVYYVSLLIIVRTYHEFTKGHRRRL
ncbi:hypothetical protein NC661_15270 [Aquibacillus koreensis]|uniref:Uncharacterized protein n=1 Tax=Aquibacillus koreensis TaxID=279446 RepID=A0A9X4AJ15_9BACI|nr:hypothetical protein [Aquibacillus koreensis]MCT2534425.1 hypothetical protein [Aquibacillus koreensis]MDC3421732.1 hypothetical protein [Aquibacillus koreensis]